MNTPGGFYSAWGGSEPPSASLRRQSVNVPLKQRLNLNFCVALSSSFDPVTYTPRNQLVLKSQFLDAVMNPEETTVKQLKQQTLATWKTVEGSAFDRIVDISQILNVIFRNSDNSTIPEHLSVADAFDERESVHVVAVVDPNLRYNQLVISEENPLSEKCSEISKPNLNGVAKRQRSYDSLADIPVKFGGEISTSTSHHQIESPNKKRRKTRTKRTEASQVEDPQSAIASMLSRVSEGIHDVSQQLISHLALEDGDETMEETKHSANTSEMDEVPISKVSDEANDESGNEDESGDEVDGAAKSTPMEASDDGRDVTPQEEVMSDVEADVDDVDGVDEGSEDDEEVESDGVSRTRETMQSKTAISKGGSAPDEADSESDESEDLIEPAEEESDAEPLTEDKSAEVQQRISLVASVNEDDSATEDETATNVVSNDNESLSRITPARYEKEDFGDQHAALFENGPSPKSRSGALVSPPTSPNDSDNKDEPNIDKLVETTVQSTGVESDLDEEDPPASQLLFSQPASRTTLPKRPQQDFFSQTNETKKTGLSGSATKKIFRAPIPAGPRRMQSLSDIAKATTFSSSATSLNASHLSKSSMTASEAADSESDDEEDADSSDASKSSSSDSSDDDDEKASQPSVRLAGQKKKRKKKSPFFDLALTVDKAPPPRSRASSIASSVHSQMSKRPTKGSSQPVAFKQPLPITTPPASQRLAKPIMTEALRRQALSIKHVKTQEELARELDGLDSD
ncbi:hypothetical protein DFJ77DRAFT_514789 [Powellomyces hirtus]|nr:hypothetical protein DFJ77DRAFT_514789 [Powellomyces hirtus]